MKNLFLIIAIVVSVFLGSNFASADEKSAGDCPYGGACAEKFQILADEKCPPGHSCSEDYRMRIPQDPSTQAVSVGETDFTMAIQPMPEKNLVDRDHDKIMRFIHDSKTEICAWHELEKPALKWLGENPSIIIEKKELSFAYKVKRVSQYDGSVTSTCTTVLIVHYGNK